MGIRNCDDPHRKLTSHYKDHVPFMITQTTGAVFLHVRLQIVSLSLQFSVSYPSGVRRASSLTSSLDMRLRPAPPMATLPGNADESSNATIRKGVEIDCVG